MKVYLNDPISENARRRLASKVEIVDNFDHPEELDAIIVRQQYCTGDIISRAKKCRLIQQHGTGLDRIDLEAAKKFGIPVQNTPGMNAQSVAEYIIMMMLSLSRRTVYIDKMTREGRLKSFGMPETVGFELTGKRLGLVGSGHTAKCLADIAKNGFHMQVFCYSERKTPEELRAMGFEPCADLKELFHTCDYVSLHNLLTKETYHMIDAEIFDAAAPGLIFVNAARGGLVDETALYNALTEGKIAAAGLDVFEQQPPSTDNPLFKLDNFIAGMHVGGSTHEALERNGKEVVDRVFKALLIEG